jgi:hypothetical protein
MPTELLIAFIAFGVLPIGLMTVAWIISCVFPPDVDPYKDPRNWGSQDYDRRNQ